MVDLTFLKIQILNRPQIQNFLFLFVRIFDEESCGDAQDLEEDEPPLSNSGKFSNFEAIIEIASLRVCAWVKKIIQTAKS